MKSENPISASVEDYLKAIYRLRGANNSVGPSRLAEHLGLTAPSITLMVRRLGEQGLVVKDNGRGVALTPLGEARALEVLRKHRLSERFLVDKLGLDWRRAHIEAHRFEHALSGEVADALERFLGHPTTCPHGNPIPDGDLRIPENLTVPLATLTVGMSAVVQSVDEERIDLLDWLFEVGLVPGATLTVEQTDPSGRSRLLTVGKRQIAVGGDVANHVHTVPKPVAAAVGGSREDSTHV